MYSKIVDRRSMGNVVTNNNNKFYVAVVESNANRK